MDEKEKQIVTHFILALLFYPLYTFGGEALKLALLPYVIYMVWSKNPIYLPALFIHFSPGSTVSIFMLLTIVVMCFRDFQVIKQKKLQWIFYMLLLLLPVFAGYFVMNFFSNGKTFGASVEYMGFYLGFFTFFYGLFVAPKVDALVWKYIVICLGVFPMMSLVLSLGLVRLYWLSFPLFVCIFLMYAFGLSGYLGNFKEKKLAFFFVPVAVLFLGFKFTLFFSAVLAVIVMYVFLKKRKRVLKFFTGRQLGIFASALVILILIFGNEFILDSKVQDYSVNAFDSFDNFIDFLKFKAFNDRSILWVGGWNFLVSTNHLWPTGEPPSYYYVNSAGSLIEDVQYGIHNVGLEMMRYYGIVIGGYLTIVYLTIISTLGKVFKNSKNIYVTLFSAVLIATAVVGGITGQYIVMITFSFIMFSLMGVCYSKGAFTDLKPVK